MPRRCGVGKPRRAPKEAGTPRPGEAGRGPRARAAWPRERGGHDLALWYRPRRWTEVTSRDGACLHDHDVADRAHRLEREEDAPLRVRLEEAGLPALIGVDQHGVAVAPDRVRDEVVEGPAHLPL